jgi:hypothetical protein
MISQLIMILSYHCLYPDTISRSETAANRIRPSSKSLSIPTDTLHVPFDDSHSPRRAHPPLNKHHVTMTTTMTMTTNHERDDDHSRLQRTIASILPQPTSIHANGLDHCRYRLTAGT